MDAYIKIVQKKDTNSLDKFRGKWYYKTPPCDAEVKFEKI